MKLIGLTGGIGSGKSTIARWFKEKGIPVYDSDLEAKQLTNNDFELRKQIIALLGETSYKNGEYNRKYVAGIVFENKEILKKLNQIIHPVVFEHFEKWLEGQKTEFAIKEAAILFESGSYKDCDFIVSVLADKEIRIERVMLRDGITRKQVEERIASQWPDERKAEASDFVIYNNGDLEQLKSEFDKLYKSLLIKIQTL